MKVHRPLSEWVATVVRPDDGAVKLRPPLIPNDGDERADARALPRFFTGWNRTVVDVALSADEAPPLQVLALQRVGADETVIELNDRGQPLVVTREGGRAVAEIEENWPEVPRGDLIEVLVREDVELRHAVLDRLTAEGNPSAEAFRLLPWEMVEATAENVLSLLAGSTANNAPPLRHYFAVVGTRFTNALEQIQAGLQSDEPQAVRLGGAGLARALMNAPVERIPTNVCERLTDVLAKLVVLDPFLTYAANAATVRLQGNGEASTGRVELEPVLPRAASTNERRMTHRHLSIKPVELNVTVTDDGLLLVVAETVGDSASMEESAARYGSVFLPIHVQATESTTNWLVLSRTATGFGGTLTLRAPGTEFSVSVSGPPIGTDEVTRLPAEEVRASVFAADHAGKRVWAEIGRSLPADHPINQAVRA